MTEERTYRLSSYVKALVDVLGMDYIRSGPSREESAAVAQFVRERIAARTRELDDNAKETPATDEP